MLSFFHFGADTDEENPVEGKPRRTSALSPSNGKAPKRARPLDVEDEDGDAVEEEPELSAASIRAQKRRKVTKRPPPRNTLHQEHPSPTPHPSSNLSSMGAIEATPPANNCIGLGGTVTYIQCMDFMCHKNMLVKLSEKVNFVTGPNGSGKSAVIAALQICLGLRARATKRATDLRSLIRHGSKGHATLRVGLRNVGPYAYKPELYGKEIVVERKLLHSGGSGYRLLRGSTMKLVSRLKRDLLEIIENFGIFVDNPCCILDQESAKGFLKGDARDKYHLFLKATELDRLRRNLSSERSLRGMAKAELKSNAALIPSLMNDLKRSKSELRALSSLQILQEKLEGLRKELTWARVAECEDAFEEAQQVQEVELRKLLKAEKKLNVAMDEAKGIKEKIAPLSIESERLAKVIDAAKEKLDDLTEELHKKHAEKAKLDRVLKDRNRQLKAYHSQRKQLEARLEALHEKAKRADIDDKREKNLDAIKAMTAQKADIESKAAKVVAMIAGASVEKEKKLDAAKAAKYQLKKAKAGVIEAQKELKELQSTKRNRVARFGGWMPRLLQRIEESKDNFHRKPIHIGLNVQLSKPKFWRPVESCLNRHLQRFLVSDHHDRAELRKIAGTAGLKRSPDMIMMRFLDHKHEVKQVPDHMTMTSALTIPDANVFNALVDMCSIERHVLTANSSDAMRAAFVGPVGRKRMPDGVLACWDMKGNKFTVRGGSEAKEASRNFSAKHSRYFSEDVTQADLDEAQQRVDDGVYEIQRAEAELKEAKHSVKELEGNVKGLEATQAQSVEEQSQVEESLRELRQTQNDLANNNATIAIADVTDNLDALKERILAQVGRINEAKAAIKQFVEHTLRPADKKVSQLRQREKMMDTKCAEVMDRLDSLGETLQLNLVKETQAKLKHDACKERHEAAVEKTKVAEKQFVAGEAAALRLCYGERISRDGLPSVETLTTRTNATVKQLEREQERQSSIASPEEMITRAKARVKRCQARLDRTVRNEKIVRQRLRNLRKACNHRFRRWQQFKSSSMLWTASSFSKNLSHRGHEGSVIFDDDREEIRFKWKKSARDEDRNDDADTDTKQLSGGEKTFTTLALLIAIGQVMETPFRVMDEFDVFMDNANRAEAIKMLVDMARDSGMSTQQYIFLTPHDVSMLVDEKDVRVQVLPKVS